MPGTRNILHNRDDVADPGVRPGREGVWGLDGRPERRRADSPSAWSARRRAWTPRPWVRGGLLSPFASVGGGTSWPSPSARRSRLRAPRPPAPAVLAAPPPVCQRRFA